MSDHNDSLFVFRDEGGKRWPRLRRALLFAGLLVFLGSILFVRYLIITPQLHLPDAVLKLRAHLRETQTLNPTPTQPPAPVPLWLRFSKPAPAVIPPATPSPVARRMGTSTAEVHLGFYVGWDADSLISLATHAGQLTHVSPEWLTLVDGEGTLEANPDPQVLDVVTNNHLILMPLLRNLVDDVWQSEAVEGLINGPLPRQDRFIDALIGYLKDADAGGVLIDWNQMDPAYQPQLTRLLARLAEALHRQDMELWLCVPIGLEIKAFDLEALAHVVDRFVAMLHDENSEIDAPGPVASQPWFDGWLQTLLAYGSPEQWVIAVGTYGYDWEQGQKEAQAISFADVMTRAGRAGLHDCRSQAPLYNPHFSYLDNDTEHSVWFLDGGTFYNQVRSARKLHAGGIAVSRLGTEDPAIWQVLPLARPEPGLSSAELDGLRAMLPGAAVAQVGDGDFLMIDDTPAKGYREAVIDDNEELTLAYRSFPAYTTISHQGKGEPDEVTITFDDGPDPEWTPDILDILKDKGVKAAFFMVGERMEEHPELVERVIREGHEVGVHTYTHPNLAEVSGERAELELKATQRLFETITHRSTFLFRPPYNADSQPQSQEELTAIKIAQNLGYLTVSSDIDPEDWGRPGVDTIVQRVKDQRPQGNIILLHDAGGNRSQTVAALPLIIDYLRERGDRLVSLGQLLGASGTLLMTPPPEKHQPLQEMIGGSGFRTLRVIGEFCWAFMIVATILVSLRTFTVALLAQRHRYRHSAQGSADDFQPPISIVIAAYNEEKVIARTLENLLQSTYPGTMEILVVNDGSVDETEAVVSKIAAGDRRIRLLSQTNLGKAKALQAGFQNTIREIIVTLDADTIFQSDTITHLVRALRDEKVGAVSGHVKVGNQRTLVARFQDLEYTCGFNLDRRAYHQLDCITVVPGAASAWRRSAVMAAGGISSDTLAEDTDLTLSLHRAGYRIAYAFQATAWTEAPENFPALAKQRFRWAFGTLQCLWKHRDMVGNLNYKALGWFSLPSIWIFQIFLVAVSPLIDGLLVFSLFIGMQFPLILYLLAFLIMDLLLAMLACWMEKTPLRVAWRILPMRFLYRPLLAWVVWKSIIRAAKGALVGWGKLERSASIKLKTEN